MTNTYLAESRTIKISFYQTETFNRTLKFFLVSIIFLTKKIKVLVQ